MTHLEVDLETTLDERLGNLRGLGSLDRLDLLAHTLELAVPQLVLGPLRVLLGLLLSPEGALVSLLLLGPGGLLVGKLLAALDDLGASDEGVALVGTVGLESGESGGAGSEGSGDGRMVGRDDVESGVEGGREASEVGAEEGGSGRLEGLDAVVLRRGRGDGGAVRTEELLVELDRAGRMVDGDIEVAATASLGDEALDALAGDLLLAVLLEGGELDDALDLERGVDLSELLEEAGEDDVLEGLDVTGSLGLGLELGEDGLNLRGDGEGVEVDLEDVVEGAELGADALENVAVEL